VLLAFVEGRLTLPAGSGYFMQAHRKYTRNPARISGIRGRRPPSPSRPDRSQRACNSDRAKCSGRVDGGNAEDGAEDRDGGTAGPYDRPPLALSECRDQNSQYPFPVSSQEGF